MGTQQREYMSTSGKYKIAVINSYYYPDIVGGAEIVVKTLAEWYRNLGMKVFVISSAREDRLDLVNGIKVYRVKNRNIYWGKESSGKSPLLKPIWHLINTRNPFTGWKIFDILDYEKPDVVHIHNLTDISFGILKTIKDLGIPVLLTLHDYSFMCIRATMFKGRRNCENICFACRFYASLKRKYVKNVNFVVGVSKFLLERHWKHGFFNDVPSTVIYNPVTTTNPENVKKDYKSPVYGFIGRLHPSKGIELLIDAFNRLKLPLKIAGEPFKSGYGEYLRSLSKSDKTEFLGWIYAEDFYREIDVLIVPSLWHDPSPTVVHEANAYGIPVVASSRGGLPELVKDGFNGLIFDPEIDSSLIKVIERTDKSTWKQLSENSFIHAKKFTPEIVAKNYLDIISDLILKR